MYICQIKENKAKHYLSQINAIKSKNSNNNNNFFTSRVTVGAVDNHCEDPSNLLKFINTHYIRIIEIIECGYFWAQIADDEHDELVDNIQSELNDENDNLVPLSSEDVEIGKLVAALYIEESDNSIALYRAKIIKTFNHLNSIEV